MVLLAAMQRQLGRLAGAAEQDRQHAPLLRDVVRESEEEEREDHQDREGEQQVDQLVRRAEAEDPRGLAVHAPLLGARIHVLVDLDGQRANEGDHDHKLRAHGEVVVLVVLVRLPDDDQHQHGHADHQPDEDADERAGLVEEEHPAGEERPTHELDELPVEALRVVVAVQEGRRLDEAVGRAAEQGPPRREQKHGVQHEHAERPQDHEHDGHVRRRLVRVAGVALDGEVLAHVVDGLGRRVAEALARPRLEDAGAHGGHEGVRDDERKGARRQQPV